MKVDYQWKIIDQIAAPILILNSAGEICYFNDHARGLLGIGSQIDIANLCFSQFISETHQSLFDKSLVEVLEGEDVADLNIDLDLENGEEISVTLGGEALDDREENDQYSIWTISVRVGTDPNGNPEYKQTKLEDMQWLADQGRILLSLDDWSEILYQSSQALQEKLGECYILTLMMLDDSNVQLEGIHGIGNRLLNQIWKLVGKNLHDRIFPIDDRFRDTYSQRSLFKHPGGLEEFAISQVPEKMSKKISSLVGLKDIYTIGLEGKREVLGCFYILTINNRPPINAELVESFAFQVALALDKCKYAMELEISENQFQTIFEFAPDGYYICDLQGILLNANWAAEQISGYSKEEMIGKSILKAGLLPLDQIPKVATLLSQSVRGKNIEPVELDFNRKDGSEVSVEILAYPVKMGDQPVILGIARDISQRNESEKSIKTAHNTLTHVLEGIDAHVYVADMDTHEILYMNKRMIEDYGGNFVGKLCYEVFRKDKKVCHDCSNQYLLNSQGNPGEVHVWEGQNLRTEKWYRNYDRAIYWSDQRLVRLEIAVDITENRQMVNSLVQSEERYRSLFKESHDAIMTLSPPDWQFTSGNTAMIDVFDLEDEKQFLSLQPWQLSPEYQSDGRLSAEKAREMIQIAVDQGSNYFSWTHMRISGEEFPATVQLTRVDAKEDYFIQATVRDVTDQVDVEEKLEQQMQDLTLMNDLNVAANQGMNLGEILDRVSQETERLFSSRNTTVYLLNEDKTHLQVNLLNLNNSLFSQLEKIAGISLPENLEIPIKDEGLFYRILGLSDITLLSKQDEIYELVYEYLNSTFLSDKARRGLKKLDAEDLPIDWINSVIVAPLISASEPFGFITLSRDNVFLENEINRFKVFADQLSGIILRVEAEENQARKLQELRFLNKTIGESGRFDDIDEICVLLADAVREINPQAYIMVSLLDPDQNAIRVRAVKGIGEFGERLFKMMGGKPQDFQIDTEEYHLDDDLNQLFTSGRLERIPGGLYDLTRGKIPKKLCKSIERMVGVQDIYIAGFGLGGKSTGGLILFLKEGDQINFPDAIQSVVSNFAVVIERRMIQQEVLGRKQQLEALRDIELEIASDLDIESLLQSISAKSTAIVNASASGFSIFNPDRGVLEYTAYTGFEKLPENTDVYPGEGLSGKVWDGKETIIVENYSAWEGRLDSWVPVGDYYLAGIPISSGDEMLGVLEIALDTGKSLSVSELSTLELFATQAAIALKNARLFTNEKLRRIEADTLREVGVMINMLVDQPELLDMILMSLQKVVFFESASIQLLKGSEVIVEAYLGAKSSEEIIGKAYKTHGNKVAEWIIEKGENILLRNEFEVNDWLDDYDEDQIRSFLAVPLESKSGRIGILTLDHTESNHFTSRDGDLVRDYSAQAVVAIENNRLFKDIRRKTDEIEAVYASALSLTKELHPDILFEQLYQLIEPLFKPDAYILATYEDNTGMIKVAYATESGVRQPQAEGTLISPGDQNSLLGWIVRKKIPLLIGNIETDSLPLRPQQRGEFVRSWLGVPLLIGDRVTGALIVQSYEADMYTADHQRLIQLLGNQVAIALENSRLFDEAQRRLSRLSSLREIDEAISGGTDLELTMEVLIRQLVNTLEVDAACVLEYKPAQNMLEYVDAMGFRTKSLQHTSLKLGEGLAGRAALEQNLVIIQDLNAENTSFQQSPFFRKEEFVSYFAQPLITTEGLVGVLEVFNRSPLTPNPEWFLSLDAIARLAAIAIDRLNLYDNLEKSNIELVSAYDATIEGWAKAIELRDGDTEGHSRRVAALTLNLARMMDISGEELIHMRRGALLHDIGKMAVPDGILLKAGKLSEEEWAVMRKHPGFALEMLSKIEYLRPALDIPYGHHERWDGSGYPEGKAGEDIPLQARIFAVVDVWDALQSDRPYREAWSEQQTISYLIEKSGSEFDPHVVEVFLKLIEGGLVD